MMKKRIFAALIALVMLFLCACQQQADPTEPADTTPSETIEQTIPVTDPPTEPPTEPTEPPFQLHSGIREDGSFNEGTLFIGDSLTYGLVTVYLTQNDLLGDARYMTMPGMPISVFFSNTTLTTPRDMKPMCTAEFARMKVADAVAQAGEQVTAVYFMMGTNQTKQDSPENYIEIVDYVMECCPNATFYLLLIPHISSEILKHEVAHNNIKTAYEHFQQEGTPNVMLVDTYTAIGQNLLPDGIHLTYEGQECWYNALVAFAQENNIPE